jgi:hypothetical protein
MKRKHKYAACVKQITPREYQIQDEKGYLCHISQYEFLYTDLVNILSKIPDYFYTFAPLQGGFSHFNNNPLSIGQLCTKAV